MSKRYCNLSILEIETYGRKLLRIFAFPTYLYVCCITLTDFLICGISGLLMLTDANEVPSTPLPTRYHLPNFRIIFNWVHRYIYMHMYVHMYAFTFIYVYYIILAHSGHGNQWNLADTISKHIYEKLKVCEQ